MIIVHYSSNYLISISALLSSLEILAVYLVYPFSLPVIFLLNLKFSLIFEQQESQLIYISYYIIIAHCHSNHLIIPISVLCDFWFLRNTHFYRYTPSIFCDFSLIFKVSSILEQHESLIIIVSYFLI